MIVTSECLNVEEYERRKILPATLIDRAGSELWLVREEPVGSSNTGVAWSYANEGGKVRIPMFPYLTARKLPSCAIGLSGAICAQIVAEALRPIAGREILRMHIVFGDPVEDRGAAFRFWIGMALQLRS